MDLELLTLLKTWNITFFIQNKRKDGMFHRRYQWRAMQFKGLLKEYNSPIDGFESPEVAVKDCLETLSTIQNVQPQSH